MNMANGGGDYDGGINVSELFARLWASRWLVVISTVVFIVIFGYIAFFTTPVYRATTMAVPASTDRAGLSSSLGSALGSLGGLASFAGVNLRTGGAETEEALAVMRSRGFTQRFIDDQQLLPELFAERWDAQARQWRKDSKPAPTLVQGYNRFNKIRSASLDMKTGLISVSVDWKDPVKAAHWANELVMRLNAEMRARAIASTKDSVRYLQSELASTATIETRDAINRLMEAQINQRMLANVTEQYAWRVVDKALPPDSKDVVRPKKALLLALGLAVGVASGIFLALLMAAFKGIKFELGKPIQRNELEAK